MFTLAVFRLPHASALGLAFALGVVAPQPVEAAAGPFERFLGAWTGGGQVVGSNGNHERIRCRAQYSSTGHGIDQSIVCASQSYKIDMQSYVEVSGESVQGYWRETTRQVTGHLTGRIADNRFEGTVSGPGFTAAVSLTSDGRRQAVDVRPQGGDISAVRIELERR
jgi:hypothetical protein